MLLSKSLSGLLRDSVAYIAVSVVGYGMIFGLMFLFVDVVGLERSFAFFMTYLFAYVFDYISNLMVVFRKGNSHQRLFCYLIYLIFFFFVGNVVFYAVVYFVKSHYLLETLLTMLILFPLRFFTLRYLVFR
jgi:putative flippase GtrA